MGLLHDIKTKREVVENTKINLRTHVDINQKSRVCSGCGYEKDECECKREVLLIFEPKDDYTDFVFCEFVSYETFDDFMDFCKGYKLDFLLDLAMETYTYKNGDDLLKDISFIHIDNPTEAEVLTKYMGYFENAFVIHTIEEMSDQLEDEDEIPDLVHMEWAHLKCESCGDFTLKDINISSIMINSNEEVDCPKCSSPRSCKFIEGGVAKEVRTRMDASSNAMCIDCNLLLPSSATTCPRCYSLNIKYD